MFFGTLKKKKAVKVKIVQVFRVDNNFYRSGGSFLINFGKYYYISLPILSKTFYN